MTRPQDHDIKFDVDSITKLAHEYRGVLCVSQHRYITVLFGYDGEDHACSLTLQVKRFDEVMTTLERWEDPQHIKAVDLAVHLSEMSDFLKVLTLLMKKDYPNLLVCDELHYKLEIC